MRTKAASPDIGAQEAHEAASGPDPGHSVGEVRYVTFGFSRLDMKRIKEEMRPEYKRSDFARLARGKFYAEVAKGTAVALAGKTTRRSSGRAKARR